MRTVDVSLLSRTQWYDATETCPSLKGIYECGWECFGDIEKYSYYYLWTGERWMNLDINHATEFPKPGDYWRGLIDDTHDPDSISGFGGLS